MPSSGKKKEWMLKKGMVMGALRRRLWMESMVWMRFALGGKISVNFDGLVRRASRLGHQIIRKIQQIFFTLLQTHFWWDCEFIKSGPICWLIHFIRSTLWTDHSGSVQCAFFIFSGRPQPRSKSWCFTMPSEKALTLPWNGLGGFLLSLLSAKLIMIKIPRGGGVRSPKKCGLSGVHAVIMNKQEITFTDWPFDRRRSWNTSWKAGECKN